MINGVSGDAETTLADVKARVLQFAQERDWGQFHSPKNLSMALASEAAELMEHFLWLDSWQSRHLVDDPAKGPKIRQELADIIIYALEFANVTGMDVAQAVAEKMAENARKYPVEKAKGSAKKYDEL